MYKKPQNETYTYNPAGKKPDAVKFWWCFPSTFAIGMSSLGYLSLFRELDTNPDANPERIFTDTEKTEFALNEVDVIAFSFSFELDFLGVFKIFEKFNLPFYAKERDKSFPLVIGGGPVLSANPEPYAEFFDAVIVGEGEEVLAEFIEKYKEIRTLPSKKQKLEALAQIDGIYIPSLYAVNYSQDLSILEFKPVNNKAPLKVRKRCTQRIDDYIFSPIVTPNCMFPNTFLIETSRGCPHRCRFCLASALSFPPRYPDLQNILSAIDLGLTYTNKLGFLGALITEHPDFDKICEYLLDKRRTKEFEISVSSLRADRLTPLTVQTLVACGQRNATIAVEAGSQRLRNAINKNLSSEDITQNVRNASKYGLKGLKIYAIIGLPDETDEDIVELTNLMTLLKKENKGFKITLSISSFVPKAHTGFERKQREKHQILQKKCDFLRKKLSKSGVEFIPTSLKWDYIQAVLSLGDRRLSPILVSVYRHGGTIGSFARAYKEQKNNNIPDFDWFVLRERSLEELLPWGFIEF